MVYYLELYYLQEQKDFPTGKAILLTAVEVARWCSYYHAHLISPISNKITPIRRRGRLPADLAGKNAFIHELVDWIFDNSAIDEVFYLLLDDKPISQVGEPAKFAHHGDTSNWMLDLTESEFSRLQAVWKENGLPADLFYSHDSGLSVPYPGSGLTARLLRLIGVRKSYTPKQWEKQVEGIVKAG
ncbi:MAG: hypothetical protein P8Y03_23705 [Anaerolineales bacterium]|jgi:hypothetical protein